MLIFCSLNITGTSYLKRVKKPVIFASSHQSEIDPLLIVSCLPFWSNLFPIIYVTREKAFYTNHHWKWWQKVLYGGSFFRMIGGYQTYVGLKDYKQALAHHLETLALGHNVGIFPAGKRVKSKNEPIKVRGGVSFLAQESNAVVVPVLIEGLEKLNFLNAIRGEIKAAVTFGQPFYLKDVIKEPKKMKVTKQRNDYEHAAKKIWKRIERLKSTV